MLEGIISSLTEDLQKIREDAQSVHHCLATQEVASSSLVVYRCLLLTLTLLICCVNKAGWIVCIQSAEQQQQKISELMEMCRQKDDVIDKLQAAMDGTVANATRDVNTHVYLHV